MSQEQKWLVVGISGVTCGGKTTLARKLHSLLPNSIIVSQDNYFHDINSPFHTHIPELNHINWEILSSIDMSKMKTDIMKIIGDEHNLVKIKSKLKDVTVEKSEHDKYGKNVFKVENNLKIQEDNLIKRVVEKNIRIMIIEGFVIFGYEPIEKLCHLKYFITLPRDICLARRSIRIYDPPDVPGYFDMIVWPEYEEHRNQVIESISNLKLLDGNNDLQSFYNIIIYEIYCILNNEYSK